MASLPSIGNIGANTIHVKEVVPDFAYGVDGLMVGMPQPWRSSGLRPYFSQGPLQDLSVSERYRVAN